MHTPVRVHTDAINGTVEKRQRDNSISIFYNG